VPAGPGCAAGPFGVDLVGVDLGRLYRRVEQAGVVTGYARIEGRFRAGTMTVTDQAPAVPPRDDPPPPIERPPCRAPAGGWRATRQMPYLPALTTFVQDRPRQYSGMAWTFPNGFPTGSARPPGYPDTPVLVIGTVLDRAVAQRQIRPYFGGNLCIVRTAHSAADAGVVYARLHAKPDRFGAPQDHGILGSRGPFLGRLGLAVLVLDQPTLRYLQHIDPGVDIVDPEPWLRPAAR
jgi:hypothetical protein